jgi:type VI secretion system protein ImpC
MEYQVNFGSLATRPSTRASGDGSCFRIALLGDFSAGANRGRLETGKQLATRKALKVDCDNLDATLMRLKVRLTLPAGPGGSSVELSIASMEDFHPDQLFENLEFFAELSGLRQRLENSSTFAKAASEVQSWAGTIPPQGTADGLARGSVIPADGKLSDFSALVGRPSAQDASLRSLKELLRELVAPYVVQAADPRQPAMIGAVDEALSAAMRGVLDNPDFQALEALWRSVDFLVRRLETDESLQIVLYDISAEELAADLSKADSLDQSGLYDLLIEQPAGDANQGPLSAIIGLYTFERTPPHAELLGRLARIVAEAPAVFLSAVGADCLDQDPKDLHPLIKEAWGALAKMPEAGYLGLASPRFLLRLPYGAKTEPIESFEFEEFTPKTGLRGMLWGNPAVIGALLLGQTFAAQGSKMSLGSVLGVGEMPFYYFTDKDGDQVALPCTERMMTARLSSLLTGQGLIPLVCMKGSPEVRLGGFGSIAGHELGGTWAPIAARTPATVKAPPRAAPAPPPANIPAAVVPTPPAAVLTAPPAKARTALAEPQKQASQEAPRTDAAKPPAQSPAPPKPAVPKTAAQSPTPEKATAPAPVEAKPAASPKPAAETPPAAPAANTELDNLLADLAQKKEEKQEAAGEGEMDPELKALLADL